MTRNERIVYYATAPRASAGQIQQLIDGKLKRFWVAKLRGKFVSFDENNYKFETREEAVDAAKQYRRHAIDEANRLGLAL